MNTRDNDTFSIKCKWCGWKIHFELFRDNGRKQIPLNDDNSIHHCIGSRSFSSTKRKIIYKLGAWI
jgi:hypothetical protein